MKIIPIASDSMGVRSAATLVETESRRIVIDPGADLAPTRFNLPPAEIEKSTLNKLRTEIEKAVMSSGIIVISHYHQDHFNPESFFYKDKQIFVKSWKSDINYSQRERALILHESFKRSKMTSNVIIADGIHQEFDSGLELAFSHAVPHGAVGTKTGYVIMTTVRENDFIFMHCSDTSGPIEPSTAQLIIAAEPDLVYLDGPPINLLDKLLTIEDLEKAINNISDILNYTHADVILDHHLLRDVNYRELLKTVYAHKSRVQSAAEFAGLENNLLEANREKLWKK